MTAEVERPVNVPPVSAGTQMVVLLSIAVLQESPANPRTQFGSDHDLLSFGHQLKREGIKTPLRVMKRPDGRYEILAGARRYRASKLVGIETLPCLVLDKLLSASEIRLDQLSDAANREGLSLLDTAASYQALMKDNRWNQAQLADALGISESKVSKALSVKANLIPAVQEHVKSNRVGVALAYELARIPVEDQLRIGNAVAVGEMSEVEAKALLLRMGRAKGGKVPTATVKFALVSWEAVKAELDEMKAQAVRLEKAGAEVDGLKKLWK
jgi:ParB family chromosome partitioning protein